MRAHDWSHSPLGDPANWPQSLRSVVQLMLGNRQLMFVAWGPELAFLYNDGYAPTFGAKHPWALGRPFREVWAEIWSDIEPLVSKALGGETTWSENLHLVVARNGQPEDAWFTFSYSPLHDESGAIAGMFCAGIETTAQVLAERRLTEERERQRRMLRQMPGFAAMLAGPEHRYEYVNDAYREIAGEREFIGRTVRDVFPDIAGQGFYELLDRVYATGEPFAARAMPISLERADGERFIDLLYEPVRDDAGQVTGIFVGGYDVTEQVRGRARVQAERDRARGVLENMAEGFVLLDRDFRVLDINAEGMRLETRPREAIIGKTHWEAWPGTEDSELGRLYKRAMAERVAVGREHRYDWPDGRHAWIDMRAYPVEDGLALFYRDVTDRKDAEEVVRQASAEAAMHAAERETILSQLAEGVIITDAEGQITFVNEAAERLHGVKLLGVAPDNYTDSYHLLTENGAPYPPRELPLARAILDGETSIEARWRIRRPDGTEVLAIGSAQPIVEGKPIGAVLTVRDDTERMRAELELRDTSRRLDAILNNTREAVFLMDHRQQCVFANAAAEALTGYGFAELQGRPLHDVVHHRKPDGSHYPLEECPIDRAFPERAQMSGEELFVAPDGSFYPVAFTASPVLDEGGRPIGTVIEARNIADEKAREAALRESEARFRNMADHAPVMMWVTDAEARCTYLNRAWYTFTGQSEVQGEGFGWLDAVHPGDRGWSGEIFLAANAKHEAFRLEYRLRRHDGAYRWAIDAASPRFGPTGEFLGYIGSVIDIDERREAEEALRRSEERYRALFETIESGFCVVEVRLGLPDGRSDYRVVEANPAFYGQTGFPEAILGRWLREAAPALEEHWYETYGRVARTGEPERFEQGSATLGRWFDVYAFRVGDPTERRVAILFNDISARRVAEERLRELNETLEAQVEERTAERDRIWRLIPDLLMVGSLDGRLLAVNPAWAQVLGFDDETLLSRPFWELIHPDFLAASGEAVRAMKEGRTTRHQNQVRTAGGEYRWFDWVSTPVGDIFYAVARDITAEKTRELELAQAQDALRQSQKMEAVGQLTGGIAHDFNNMLAVVIGSLDLLGRRIGTDDARARRYVDAAADGARRAALLTQRLLAFSRQQPLRPESVDVNKLVTGMSGLIRGSLGSDVRLETVLAGGGWRTHADPNQLENVLLNLAVNARDAMPDGGRLTIETQNAHLDARYAAAHLGVPAGQYALIAVTDTGSGMSPEVIAKAFDPFFTTKEVGKGTGLGLSQVYGFVKQSGGHVKIYSEPGQGTTVKVYLPRLIGSDHDGAADEAASDVPLGDAQEVVLVVEDEPAVRQFSVDALGELGYRVLEADGAEAALRLLDAHPEVALLFTDVVMPDVNGAKLAEEARRRRPDLKVLFTTGYTRNAVVHNGVLDGGVELIGKPFTIEELAAKVREVLDRPAASSS